MLKYAEIAQNIIDAHPESVHQLLMRKGITKKATPEVLRDAYVLFGKPFISELTDIIHLPKRSKYSDFVPISFQNIQTFQPIQPVIPTSQPVQPVTTLETSVTEATEKKKIWDSLADVFEKVVNVSTTVATTAQTAKDIVQPANGAPNVFQTDEKKALEEAENKKFNKNLLIVSAIVIVVLVSLIFITRKK